MVLLLRRMSELPKEKSFDWTPFLVALLPILATCLTLWFSSRQENRRTKADLDKLQLQFDHETQKQAASSGTELEKLRLNAALNYSEKKMLLRQRQLEQLYGPLSALLRASQGVYDKLREQLAKDHPEQYRLEPVEGGNGKDLKVKHGTEWRSFRMLDFVSELKKVPRYDTLIAEIIAIGEKISSAITTNPGLFIEFSPVFGQYLAHYRLLLLRYQATDGEVHEPESQISGYFPRELNPIVQKGYDRVTKDLEEYEKTTEKISGLLKPHE